jgi:nifR3 family TIM-barrel protein
MFPQIPLRRTGPTIGRHAFAVASLLAPMSGVTDLPFRRIAARFGAGAVVSEMIASDLLVCREAAALLKIEGEGISPHIVQLAGCEAGWMAEGARAAEDAGADIIDINMGCPAKRVVNGWSGSALMRDLDHALTLIEATVAAVSVPVTLKMRLGWDHATMNAPELARRAIDAGVAMITVHGRTRAQFYKGEADWAAVAAVRAAFSGPLVVNGDIRCADTAAEALRLSGADAVMVGRAALGRPWLVGQIGRALAGGPRPADPDLATQHAVAVDQFYAALDHYGPAHGPKIVRKHLAAYLEVANGGPCDTGTRRAILGDDDPRRVRAALDAFYGARRQARAA